MRDGLFLAILSASSSVSRTRYEWLQLQICRKMYAADQAKGICFAYLVQRSTTLGICRINYLSPRSRSPVKLDKSTGGAEMQQIADRLETLGVSEYAERSAEKAVPFGDLPISQVKI